MKLLDKKKTKEYWEDSIKETPTREDVLKSLNELKKTDYSKPVEDKLKEKHSTDKTKELDWIKDTK